MSFLQLRSPKFNNVLDIGPLPEVSTQAATGIGGTSVTANGTLIAFGATPVTVMGFVYSSTNPNPTLADSVINDPGTSIGTFSDSISGLSSSTSYFFAAYATNSQGTAYGQVLTFSTSGGVVAAFASTLLLMGVG